MQSLVTRFNDLLVSVYLYNEYTGYKELERLIESVRIKFPEEKEFIRDVEKHCDDERKHYLMFRNYFKKNNRMPFKISPAFGYVDLFINHIFRKNIQDLDRQEMLSSDVLFFKLCRLVMMTEYRGMKQVHALLQMGLIKNNPALFKIFKVIERDEPSHCYPYQYWLKKYKSHLPQFQERITDLWIHYSLTLIKIPYLFFNFRLIRMKEFYA